MKITEDQYSELAENYQGVCLECGAVRDNTEPDAEGYECPDEACGALRVVGAEQGLISGDLEFCDDESESEVLF